MITEHVGDATQPELKGRIAIVHILSDTGAYEKGFAKAVAERHPLARTRYKQWAQRYDSGTHHTFKLGAIQWVGVGHDLGRTHRFSDRWVINMVAQHGLRSATNPHPIDYTALDQALAHVAADHTDETLVMPRIGCHLAGGTWDQVGPLVENRLGELDVHVYDLAT